MRQQRGDSVDVVRTPEESLKGLPDFPFESSYREIDGLRLAYLDEGEGKPVVFFHGEPTWSFLWRKVIPPVRDAGYRCIAPDYAGFGRSDKPTDLDWYTYDRHVDLMSRLLEELDVRDATAVVHDWGGPIGLRLAVEHRPLLPDGDHGDRPLHRAPADERRLAQFPRVRPRERRRAGRDAGPRRLQGRPRGRGDRRLRSPLPEPRVEGRAPCLSADPANRARRARAVEGKRVADALREDDRPTLVLWADSDPILPFSVGERVSTELDFPAPRPIENASHFLQEDAGEEIGRIIAEWL